MCHYCCYIIHIKSSLSSNLNDNKQHVSHYFKRRRTRSYQLTVPLCLVSLTLFFIMLNMTLVLSQSSQTQQQRDQSSNKILQENSRGKENRKSLFVIYIFLYYDSFDKYLIKLFLELIDFQYLSYINLK
jgi:hypothetical protein